MFSIHHLKFPSRFLTAFGMTIMNGQIPRCTRNDGKIIGISNALRHFECNEKSDLKTNKQKF